MSMTIVAAAPTPPVALPCPLPERYAGEPLALSEFRDNPDDEKNFLQLRRRFRENEDWRALATLLVLYAANCDNAAKTIEHSVQAYELWLERVKDKHEAAHALVRAVLLQPDNARLIERLRKLYETLGWHGRTLELLRWRLKIAQTRDPAAVPGLHLEIAQVLEEQLMAVGDAVTHYEQALASNPGLRDASSRLIQLYLDAGAWRRAVDLMDNEIGQLEAMGDLEHVATRHRQLAQLEALLLDNVASAARHLQAALKVRPDDVACLRAFGTLYLSSGKASEEGLSKAADIFFKAAQIARRQGDARESLKLLRRALAMRPNHQDASAALERALLDVEDWLSLDELYRDWLKFFQGADAVPLLLRRAHLLDARLHRREEARRLYEEASRYQSPDGEAWQRLEEIYAESNDFPALVALLEAQAERMPDRIPADKLLRTAKVLRDELGSEERAAVYYYKVLEREPFNAVAFEGYKEHWRRKQNWTHLRDLILYQIDQALAHRGSRTPLRDPAFAEEFVELADICERRLGDVDGAIAAWSRMSTAYGNDPRPRENIDRIQKRARMWDNMLRTQEAELHRTREPAKRLDILKRLTQVYRDRQVDPQRAIELYSEILQLSPGDVQAQRSVTALYDRAGDYARVVEMLKEQHDRSRSNTERIALLRRMAELWHHELRAPDQAIWACEQILSHAPADRDALHRLQQLLEEQRRAEGLIEALERELRVATNNDEKIRILRRQARVAERDLHDHDRAAEIWSQMHGLLPNSLEVVDKMVAILEQAGRPEELSALLSRTASSSRTPVIRQLDYLLRLGKLAEEVLGDRDLARNTFERVLRIRADHRGALEALARLYREDRAWTQLVTVLGTLQELIETDQEVFRIAWERAEVLADRLDDPEASARVLEQLPEEIRLSHPELARTQLDLFSRAGQHRNVIRQAELMLLAAEAPDERRQLFEIISETWLRHLDDKQAALAAYGRFIHEFSDDLDGLWTMANLQEEVGDYEGTLATLQRRLELSADPQMQLTSLEHMASVCESGLRSPARALDLLRQGLALDPTNDAILMRIDGLAREHSLWTSMLPVFEQRFNDLGRIDHALAQVDSALQASRTIENEIGDPQLAFDWARRGYLVAVEQQMDGDEAFERLRSLAEDHSLWPTLLGVIEQEIDVRQSTGLGTQPDARVIDRLLSAAEIAENQMLAPEQAVKYLQRARRIRPDDPELAQRLEATAERHDLWSALVELQEDRLARAETQLGRFDACSSIARIYEDKLNQPNVAFTWLRKGWSAAITDDPALAQEALDAMNELAERHNLWPQVVEHQLARADEAFEDGDEEAGIQAIRDAASVHETKLDDPLAAIRVLMGALAYDPQGETVLPLVRKLAAKLDERRDFDQPPLGALAELLVLQRIIGNLPRERKAELLKERAEIRDARLGDHAGAMAEWLRIFAIDPDRGETKDALERLAREHDLWQSYLIVPGYLLEQSTDIDEQANLYTEIADIYEHSLKRPEYSLRAWLEAWRRHPELPPHEGELDGIHTTLWRLAAEAPSYATPPVPRDPSLLPIVDPPELQDAQKWQAFGIDPRTLERGELELGTGALVLEDDADAEVGAPSRDEITQNVSISEILPIGEIDEIHDEADSIDDIEEIADLEVVDENTQVVDTNELEEVEGSKRGSMPRAAAPPPPPPAALDSGLPPLPKLSDPLLAPRPRVSSAWEELAAAYAEAPVSSKAERAEVALVLARVWSRGAGQLDYAFEQYENALLLVPEMPEALEALAGLAEQHNAWPRLALAYERLINEAALPEHMVANAMRAARLYERLDEPARAESRYRHVLNMQPRNVAALEAVAAIQEREARWADYVDTATTLLEVQAPELEDSERVARVRALSELLENELGRTEEAIDRLEHLVRDEPHHREVHEDLVHLLLKHEFWQKAIDALRTAAASVLDEAFRRSCLARIAEIYESRLGIPERAIEAFSQILEIEPDDDAALGHLQELYFATSRFEQVIPVLERRIELAETRHDHDGKIALLVAKARALQEGLGDEAGATSTLEQLLHEAPDNDEVALGLSRLYRRTGRFERGVEVLRDRIQKLLPSELDRRVRLTVALAEVLAHESKTPELALAEIQAAMQHSPKRPELLNAAITLSRELHDLPNLVEHLTAGVDPDGWLEAADVARTQLKDPARATRLYSRVLAHAKQDEVPDDGRRLVAAIEGLVKLRVDAGDVKGAIDFMDRQLAAVDGPSVRARLLTDMGRITYHTTQDVQAARARFDAALAEDPDCAPAKLGLGELLLEAGSFDEADVLLNAAVEAMTIGHDQEHLVEGLVLQARLLERTDRATEAHRRLIAALRHDPDNLGIRTAIVRNRFVAQRWRETLVAVDQLDKYLSEGNVHLSQRQAQKVADLFVLAAESEAELKQDDGVLTRYRRALAFDPNHRRALEAVLPLCQEQSLWIEAAQYAVALARGTDDEVERARRFVDAALMHSEAISALGDAQKYGEVPTEQSLRQAMFDNLRMGLNLVERHGHSVLDRGPLEAAFRATSEQQPSLALRILDRLLLREDVDDAARHDLLLEGVRLSVASDDLQSLARAEDYAKRAHELAPNSPATALALARVLEASGHVEAIEPLVVRLMDDLDGRPLAPEEAQAKIELLIRFAELQKSRPKKAIAALELASQLDANALGAGDRRTLASLYARAGVVDERALENHMQLIALDPLHTPSLSALANHYVTEGRDDQAYALFRILALVEPENEEAKNFLRRHEVNLGVGGELDMDVLLPLPPSDGGIIDALRQLWDGGSTWLAEHLPRTEVPQEARISPVGEGLLSESWSEVLKRLGQKKVALVDGESTPALTAMTNGTWFGVHCQQPPIIVATAAAKATDDVARLRFALGRAVYFTRPEAVFATGLPPESLAELLSATLQAFHPRHARRKHHARDDDKISRLSQELARKLPIRVARQLSTLFKEHESEAFDSREWRSWIQRAGNRVGLVVAGDVEAALQVLLGEEVPRGEALRERIAADPELRDLIAFATSEPFVEARKRLGFEVSAH